MMTKPKVGIFGLTGCAGDQLAILNCEDELLDLVELIDIRSFVMAASQPDEDAPLDIAFVEGAVVTDRDEQVLRTVRERSSVLVAIGTCAVWGGVAAAANDRDWSQMLSAVYGPLASAFHARRPRALDQVVNVDVTITGCPIEKHEFLSAVACLLNGQPPVFARYPVCTECKMQENECVLLATHAFCCGPLTVAGCNARCPSIGVGCIGCRGPAPDANYPSAARLYAEHGFTPLDIRQRLTAFAAGHAEKGLAGGAA